MNDDKYRHIPKEMRDQKQWVAAHIFPSTTRPGKTEKVPINPATGKNASSSDPATWGTFEEALQCYRRGKLQGIGCVFSKDDPFTGIDFDGVIDADGNIEQWALDYVRLCNSYAERSQSGTGIHIIARGELPPGRHKLGQVEMYDSGRFFVFTGDVLEGYETIRDAQDEINLIHRETFGASEAKPEPVRQPAQPVNLADGDLLAKAQAAKNGYKFTALWNGSTTGYPSQSEADLALCSALAFWTGGDAGRIDSFFRQSGLHREKWDEPHYSNGQTYGEATIAKALATTTEFYHGNGHEPKMFQPDADAPEPPEWYPDDDGQEVPYMPPITSTPKTKKVAQIVVPKPSVQRQTSWTPAELLAAEFPEPTWVVPDLVTVGLTLLAGRPKLGKSMFGSQTAIAVGTGGMVLGRRVKPGRVLYLALEDNARRLQKRTARQGMPSSAQIRFELAWPLLTDNGITKLDAAIKEYGYNFVIIDTIGRALGRADTQDWSDMNAYVGELQTLANAYDIAILCLDHHRKPNGFAGDPVDDIQGSTAKAAVADCIIGLYKEQGRGGARLSVRGRDIEDQQLAISWDALTFSWHYDGTVDEVALRGNKGKVIDALRNSAEPMTATELEKAAGIGRTNLYPILNELVTDGTLERLSKEGKEVPYRMRVEL